VVAAARRARVAQPVTDVTGASDDGARVSRRWLPKHASTWTYILWAAIYLLLEILRRRGVKTPRLFGEILGIDVIMNFLTPFIFIGSLFFSIVLSSRTAGVPWVQIVAAAAFPLALLLYLSFFVLEAGGVGLLVGTVIFYTRINVPAMVLSSWSVGRHSLTLARTDWVPLFGIVYFSLQAVFEEILLRFLDRRLPER
jgi:hypothetical protein